MKLNFIISILIIVFFKNSLLSQSKITETPKHFGQFYNNPFINSNYNENISKLFFIVGTTRNFGNFGNVSTSFFATSFKLKSTKKSHNRLGFLFHNDSEGEFIRRNRGYISFTRNQKINRHWFLSGKIALGFYAFNIKANTVTGGIANYAFDGNINLSIYNKNTKIGLTSNQLSNSQIQPFSQITELTRYYNLFIKQSFDVSNTFKITPSFYTEYIPNLTTNIGLASNLLISNVFSIGGSYEYNNGYFAFIGLQNLLVQQNYLNIEFAYFMPSLNNLRTNTNSLELILKYTIK